MASLAADHRRLPALDRLWAGAPRPWAEQVRRLIQLVACAPVPACSSWGRAAPARSSLLGDPRGERSSSETVHPGRSRRHHRNAVRQPHVRPCQRPRPPAPVHTRMFSGCRRRHDLPRRDRRILERNCKPSCSASFSSGPSRPLGATRNCLVDVRIVAATNRDLGLEVAEGRFREDLFYRLNVVAIRTVPLKDRPEDVPVLAGRYRPNCCTRHGIVPLCTLSPAAVDVLQQYPWPGNSGESGNVLERAVMFTSGDEIDPHALTGLMNDVDDAPPTPALASPCVDRPAGEGRVAGDGLRRRPCPGSIGARARLAPQPAVAAAAVPAAAANEWPTLADVERVHLGADLGCDAREQVAGGQDARIDRSAPLQLQRYGLEGR